MFKGTILPEGGHEMKEAGVSLTWVVSEEGDVSK